MSTLYLPDVSYLATQCITYELNTLITLFKDDLDQWVAWSGREEDDRKKFSEFPTKNQFFITDKEECLVVGADPKHRQCG